MVLRSAHVVRSDSRLMTNPKALIDGRLIPTRSRLLSSDWSVTAGAFVRTHLAGFAKRRERADDSHRAFTTCAVSSWESEELDERPHALFLAAARKSLGSCQLGDTMEARPKQFR